MDQPTALTAGCTRLTFGSVVPVIVEGCTKKGVEHLALNRSIAKTIGRACRRCTQKIFF